MTNDLIETNKKNALSKDSISNSQGKLAPKESISSLFGVSKERYEHALKKGRTQKEILKKVNELFSDEEILNCYITSFSSTYSVPRKNWQTGETTYIRGLSIGLIKDLANLYEHLAYGVDYDFVGGSKVKVVTGCVDIYNNTSEARYFQTFLNERLHNLVMKKKSNASDEIYKFVYQEGVRRMRVCIEHILPLWMKEKALKYVLNKKLQYYKQEENRKKAFEEIFSGFQKINPSIKNLGDLSKFLKIEVTTEKLKEPDFFAKIEELYVGYRDEKPKEAFTEEPSDEKMSREDKDEEVFETWKEREKDRVKNLNKLRR